MKTNILLFFLFLSLSCVQEQNKQLLKNDQNANLNLNENIKITFSIKSNENTKEISLTTTTSNFLINDYLINSLENYMRLRISGKILKTNDKQFTIESEIELVRPYEYSKNKELKNIEYKDSKMNYGVILEINQKIEFYNSPDTAIFISVSKPD